MKNLIILITFLITISVNGQINVYINTGLANNSGSSVFPYESPSPIIEISWLLALEIEYEITNKLRVSCFAEKKDNNKGSFLGSDVNSTIYYFGIKSNIRFFKIGKYSAFELSPYIAYGNEKVKWKNTDWSIFQEKKNLINGSDRFDLLNLGLSLSVVFEFNRIIIKGSYSPNYDFVINGEREILTSSHSDLADYQEFNYKGLFSSNLQLSLGFKLFKKNKQKHNTR